MTEGQRAVGVTETPRRALVITRDNDTQRPVDRVAHEIGKGIANLEGVVKGLLTPDLRTVVSAPTVHQRLIKQRQFRG